MNFLCPSCRTPLPREVSDVVRCTQCGVQVDLTRVETDPGQARLWPEVDLKDESLSGHRLLRRIGSGGMGSVYVARTPAGTEVALKVLSPMLAAEPALRERFRREARALTAVRHPRVVRLLDEGEDRGFCWYAMDLVQGEDLRRRLVQRAMNAEEVEFLARALLEALEAVHQAGVVHRDLKPGNVLMGPQGPLLCDFGIAQISGAATLTESAALMGSLRYMAPEQRWGKADERSDLYSLGVLLHEALSGGVPGEKSLPKNVPRWLSRFIDRLTQQSPKARPFSAAEAAKLLLASKRSSRRRVAVAGVGVLLVAATAGIAALGDSNEGAEEPVAATAVTPFDSGIARAMTPVPFDAGPPAIAEAAPAIDAGEVPDGGGLVVELTPPPPRGVKAGRTKGEAAKVQKLLGQLLREVPDAGAQLGKPKSPRKFNGKPEPGGVAQTPHLPDGGARHIGWIRLRAAGESYAYVDRSPAKFDTPIPLEVGSHDVIFYCGNRKKKQLKVFEQTVLVVEGQTLERTWDCATQAPIQESPGDKGKPDPASAEGKKRSSGPHAFRKSTLRWTLQVKTAKVNPRGAVVPLTPHTPQTDKGNTMGTTTFELTEDNFEATLSKGGILIIDFWAEWCGPCRAFAPVFEAAAKKHTDVIFAKVDTEAQQGLAAAFEIQAIPTLAVFRDGVLLGRNSGALPQAALEGVIEQVRGLNMEDIKKKIAEEETKKGSSTQ